MGNITQEYSGSRKASREPEVLIFPCDRATWRSASLEPPLPPLHPLAKGRLNEPFSVQGGRPSSSTHALEAGRWFLRMSLCTPTHSPSSLAQILAQVSALSWILLVIVVLEGAHASTVETTTDLLDATISKDSVVINWQTVCDHLYRWVNSISSFSLSSSHLPACCWMGFPENLARRE